MLNEITEKDIENANENLQSLNKKRELNIKIYISGKIGGLRRQEAYDIFENAEKTLNHKLSYDTIRKLDDPKKINSFIIVNPFKIHGVEHELMTWEEYMLEDIKFLFRCNTIYMLKNWKDSKGAKVEHEIAKVLNFEIIYE